MSDGTSGYSRRSILRRTGIAAGGLAVGAGAITGQVAADEHGCDGCLRICWVDVKPNSCPNSVNPDSNGTLPVTAGWPYLDPATVELIPVKADYDPAFDGCQDWSDPEYRRDAETATELCELAMASDRSASPTWYRMEDVDGDGDFDSKFKFDVADLELEPDDTFLVLRGESSLSDCTYFGIDSVRVLDGGNNGDNGNNGNNSSNANNGDKANNSNNGNRNGN